MGGGGCPSTDWGSPFPWRGPPREGRGGGLSVVPPPISPWSCLKRSWAGLAAAGQSRGAAGGTGGPWWAMGGGDTTRTRVGGTHGGGRAGCRGARRRDGAGRARAAPGFMSEQVGRLSVRTRVRPGTRVREGTRVGTAVARALASRPQARTRDGRAGVHARVRVDTGGRVGAPAVAHACVPRLCARPRVPARTAAGTPARVRGCGHTRVRGRARPCSRVHLRPCARGCVCTCVCVCTPWWGGGCHSHACVPRAPPAPLPPPGTPTSFLLPPPRFFWVPPPPFRVPPHVRVPPPCFRIPPQKTFEVPRYFGMPPPSFEVLPLVFGVCPPPILRCSLLVLGWPPYFECSPLFLGCPSLF